MTGMLSTTMVYHLRPGKNGFAGGPKSFVRSASTKKWGGEGVFGMSFLWE